MSADHFYNPKYRKKKITDLSNCFSTTLASFLSMGGTPKPWLVPGWLKTGRLLPHRMQFTLIAFAFMGFIVWDLQELWQ